MIGAKRLMMTLQAPSSPYVCQYLGAISGSTIVDATGNWPLTKNATMITGNIADSHGDFIKYSDLFGQAVSAADFTPIKSATYFEIEVDVVRLGGASTGTVLFFKGPSGETFELYYAMSIGRIRAYFSSGTTYGATPDDSYFNANVWKHIKIVYNGAGATNADRLKIYIDGSPITLSFVGTIPTSMPSTAQQLRVGDAEGWVHNSPANTGADNITIRMTPS